MKHKPEPLFLLNIKLAQAERRIEELVKEVHETQKERDALNAKYIASLNRNNSLWNTAQKLNGGLEAFRSIKQ